MTACFAYRQIALYSRAVVQVRAIKMNAAQTDTVEQTPLQFQFSIELLRHIGLCCPRIFTVTSSKYYAISYLHCA